jgi:hypothetical protein
MVQPGREQMAAFFAANGTIIKDPDGVGAIWETPIVGPLPEFLGFLP